MTKGLSEYVVVPEKNYRISIIALFPKFYFKFQYCNISIKQNLIEVLQLLHFHCNKTSIMQMLGTCIHLNTPTPQCTRPLADARAHPTIFVIFVTAITKQKQAKGKVKNHLERRRKSRS